MESILFKGRYNKKIIFLALFILLILPISGIIYFETIMIMSLLSIIIFSFSLPNSIELTDDGIYKKDFFGKRKEILKWNQILGQKEIEINQWSSPSSVITNILLFGWISLLIFGFKSKVLIIQFDQYQEYRIHENKIINYSGLKNEIICHIPEQYRNVFIEQDAIL